jgi:hypothetical protein
VTEAQWTALIGGGSGVLGILLGTAIPRYWALRQKTQESDGEIAASIRSELRTEVARLRAEMEKMKADHLAEIQELRQEHAAQLKLLRQQLDDANASYYEQLRINRMQEIERERLEERLRVLEGLGPRGA